MPVAVKPIIDRNLPPIYISYDMLEEIPVTTYIFCIPFQNAAAMGANGYNTIYARISGISGYSYAIRPPYALTPVSDIKEEYLQKVQTDYGLDREFAETYFHNSLELLERLGRVAEDQEYVICIDIQNSQADPIGLVPRQFYKVQLAYGYKDESGINQISAYSDYGIAKCVCQQKYPIILDMQGFTTEAINLQTTQDLVGRFYSQDLGERVTEFKFTITNLHDDNDIIYTTGWLPHNSASDTITSATTDENGGSTLIITSTDTAPMRKNLKLDQICQIRYEAYTTNKIYKSQDYAIVNQAWGANDFPGRLVAKPKVETGEIILTMTANSDVNNVSGMYRIEKATEDQSYSNWEAVCELRLYHSRIEDEKPIYKDKCVEQGRKYKYSIYKYALTPDGREIRTQRFYTRPVTAQFEDMFLYDGVRQLNIRFNPKVSTFKTVKLENKTETIGGKYPFLSRNGHTNYKQFAISGLISVLMDDQMTFWADPQYDGDSAARTSTPSTEDAAFRHFHSTNLENWNITRERDFKLDVLDWLNDGKPKLLRTATEGNYIVALQGVSLSPMDQLGRMLHSFSATAYEIDDLNIETLKKYNMSGVQLNYYNTSIYTQTNIDTTNNNEIKDFVTRNIGTIKFIDNSSGDGQIAITTTKESLLTYYALGVGKNKALIIQLDPNDNEVESIKVTGTNNFELTTENYLGGFIPVTGSFSFSYVQVLLDQNTNDGIKGPNNTSADPDLPLCVCGYQHLSDTAQGQCNHWLDANNTFLLNSIYQLRISRKIDSETGNEMKNWLWDASALNDSQIVDLTHLTPDEKNDIILGNLGDGKHDEIILTQEDLDDISILMAGPNLRIEIAYLYANDVSIEEQDQTQDSSSNG